MTATTLKQRLASRSLLVAPGVFDMVSLRLANTFAFEALYMTGYGMVASHLGLPDARTARGLDEALRRADAYASAGADVLFVESP